VEADVFAANIQYCVIHARTTTATRGVNCYMGFLVPGSGCEIGKNVGGVYGTVATTGLSHGASHRVRFEVEGNVQRLYVDGTLRLTGGDTSLATGNQAGLNSNSSGGSYDAYDNFRCGPLPYTP
jgi:hypothetical protein